jgi:hypothetical protein
MDPSRNTGDSQSHNSGQSYRRNHERPGDEYPSRYEKRNEMSSGYNDLDNEAYEEQTGKYEHYDGGTYGHLNPYHQGRDYEQNAGYRESYNRLPTGQWPEIDDARRRREEVEHRNIPAGVTHRGKGPRNYQRSDERIREDIEDILMEDPYVDASDIEVEVKQGEVILKGMVENKLTKRRVESLVESVAGVKQTENHLRSRRPGGEIVNIHNSGEE